ncbi:MAG: hypothetical protein COB53_03815 [Elusimicrobia bacterium]|nr:MAG: hypothetical protein COB53_03815 [Elusimicrobiota bacterium]
MNRGIPFILAAVLCVSGCGGTRRTATANTESLPSGYPEKSLPIPQYLFNQRRYSQAVGAYVQINLQTGDTPDPELKFRYERLGQLLTRLGFTAVPRREEVLRRDTQAADLAHKSIESFINEQDRHALLFAAAAQGSEPDEHTYRVLLQALEAWGGSPAEAGEKQSPDLVAAYKLRRANVLFKAKRYEDAAAQCLEALLLVPGQASAYERLGSMYYAMGAKSRAIDAWRESLRLSPANGPLKDFMARLESDGPKARTP